MRKLMRDYRYWISVLLGCAGLICLIAEPATDVFPQWVTTFAVTKIVGFILWLAAAVVFRHVDLSDIADE